jgi:hypothetical protein
MGDPFTAFAEAKSFSPLPKLLKSSSAPASEMLPRLQAGKQRPERFTRLHQTGVKAYCSRGKPA